MAVMAFACPNCGNTENFLVKTLQMHIVHVGESGLDVTEEGRPAVYEVLCDECETELPIDALGDDVRRDMLQSLGAR